MKRGAHHAADAASWWGLVLVLALCLTWMAPRADPPGELPKDARAAARAALEEGRRFGRAQSRRVEAAATHTAPDTVPGYQGLQVPQGDLYEEGLELQNTARHRLQEYPVGAFTRDAALQRPQFRIDPGNDPLLLRGRDLQAEPGAQLGAPDSPYQDCIARRLGSTPRFIERRCTRWGAREQSCERRLEPRCLRRRSCPNDRAAVELLELASDMRWTYRYPVLTLGTIADNYWSGRCTSYERSTTFNISNLERIAEFRLVAAGWDDHMRIVLNGRQVFIGPYQGEVLRSNGSKVSYGGRSAACELSVSWRRDALDIDLRPYLREGENVLDMQVIVAGKGEGWIRVRAERHCACEEWEEHWEGETCDDLGRSAEQRRCLLSTRRCLERGVRQVSGEDLERACWRERLSYFCDSASSFIDEPYCAQLRARGCTQTDSACVDRDAHARCLEYEQRYRCREGGDDDGGAVNVLDCGARLYCLGGDCFDTDYQPSGDFGAAAARLGVVEEIARDFDVEKLLIFQGSGRKCGKSVLGFSNCCKDSGWGVDLGLKRCSDDERLLAEERGAGRCHYVGSYKRGSLLLKRRYQSYCCFKSKLARIVQKQGREQLGWDWGEVRQPQCGGFSPEQLTNLDFESMDFTEFYEDALRAAQAAERPEGADMRSLLERRIRERLRP